MASRRLTRLTASPRIPPLIGQSIGRSQHKSGPARSQGRRPAAVPIGDYRGSIRTPLTGGYASGIVPASGVITLSCGPMGLGTVWYPQAAAIATSTGANDSSTCALYVGPLGLQTLIGGQSYAGGGDTIGLAVPPLWPGYYIWATWTGATKGDLATLTVYGEQDALAIG